MNDELEQEEINRIGHKLETELVKVICAQGQPSNEILIATVSALCATLVNVAVAAWGKERALAYISLAINSTIRKHEKNKEKEKE